MKSTLTSSYGGDVCNSDDYGHQIIDNDGENRLKWTVADNNAQHDI